MVPSDESTNPPFDTGAFEEATRCLVLTMLQASEVPPALVTGAQLAALRALDRCGTLTMTELAEQLGTIASWASRLCDRLEADGYVERRPVESGRRRVAVRMRPPGRAVLRELAERRRQALSGPLAAMSADEREALLKGLLAFELACRTGDRPGRSESA